MFNPAVEPKICKLMHYRQQLYEKFAREVIEKELTQSGGLQGRRSLPVRRLELSPTIALHDLTGKINRLLAGVERTAEAISLQVEMLGNVEDCRAVLQRAVRVLQTRALAADQPHFIDEHQKPVSEQRLKQIESQKEDEEEPVRVFLAQTFRLEKGQKTKKNITDNLTISEAELFSIAEEIFRRRGTSATSLLDRIDFSATEETEESTASSDVKIKVPWAAKLVARLPPRISSEVPIDEVLHSLPDLDKAIREDLANLNLPANEENLKAQLHRRLDRPNKSLNDMLRLFGLNKR